MESQSAAPIATSCFMLLCDMLGMLHCLVTERVVAPWYKRLLMVRWVVGSILYGGAITCTSQCSTTGVKKAVVCVILSAR